MTSSATPKSVAKSTTTLSMDELFRQKTLQEIHEILRKTRNDVEAKKQELRELVGDHYRSILESSDHIRAMSERAAEVSEGADRLSTLVSSMQTLAAELPSASSISKLKRGTEQAPPAAAPATDANIEYRIGQRVMAVLEVPEVVRNHLSDFRFVKAARVALVDLLELQKEVESLLLEHKKGSSTSGAPSFDYAKLMQQQAPVVRGLPQQIAASCVDGFGAPSLQPSSLVQCFAMRLLLDSTSQPAALFQVFLDHRRGLISDLLDSSSSGGSSASTVDDRARFGAKLATAALAFEGTVVLSARLTGVGAVGDDAPLVTALTQALEGARERSDSEERAAIEGRRAVDTGATSLSALQARAESLRSSLRPGGAASLALVQELAVKGSAITREWVPDGSQAAGDISKSLQKRFARLASSLASVGAQPSTPSAEAMRRTPSAAPSCAVLGRVLESCTEKIQSYRRTLAGSDRQDKWNNTWSEACARFCPGRGSVQDALSLLNTTMEVVCAEVVRERIRGLELDLVPSSDEEPEAPASTAATGQAPKEVSEAQRCEEIAEMRKQSRLRVDTFNEQLGEVLEDLAASNSSEKELPLLVVHELVKALRTRLTAVSEQVQLPAPHDPSSTGAQQEMVPWQVQRKAAKAAIALDVLLTAASGEVASDSASPSEPSQLRKALKMASAYGDQEVAREASGLIESLHQRSDSAFRVWASYTATPGKGSVPFDAFWQLADDEVSTNCGWGNAKFTRAADAGQRSVPVPVQASPFVFERLTMASRRALEVSGAAGVLPKALVSALKAALGDSFLTVYSTWTEEDLVKQKRLGMSHLLQWLFDLRFLRIVLSSGDAASGSGAAGPVTEGSHASLCKIMDKIEATTLSDPVDRLLYQEVLKASVKLHIEGVKILLSPLFMYNPLYSSLFPGRVHDLSSDAAGLQAPTPPPQEDTGFEIIATFAPPLRPMLPRFPLLPVATAASSTTAHLDPRLGLGSEAERARAAAAAAASGAAGGSGAVSSLMQQFSGGLESLGFGKAFAGGTSFFGGTGAVVGGGGADVAPQRVPRMPQAV